MAVAVPCPEPLLLSQFREGALADAEADALESHLLHCPACMAALKAGETLPGSKAATQDTAWHEPSMKANEMDVLIRRFKKLRRDGSARIDEALEELRALLAPAQAADEIGRLGHYRVRRILGRGGMGLVLEAEDLLLGRLVALKVIHPKMGASLAIRQRFLREARLAAGLRHEHVVTIYQVGEERGLPYLAMELLPGESLEARLRREPVLPEAKILRLGREMAEGLAAAHERGLTHRDVKPGNIWLERRDGRSWVKILDFGLARSTQNELNQAVTQSGMIIGTPGYMAPEQARGEPVGPQTDCFSLGCVLFEMATGKQAFGGRTILDALRALEMVEPPPVSQLRPEISVGLTVLLRRLMAKPMAERPASAKEVVETLRRLQESAAQRRMANAVKAAPPKSVTTIPCPVAVLAAPAPLQPISSASQEIAVQAAPAPLQSAARAPLPIAHAVKVLARLFTPMRTLIAAGVLLALCGVWGAQGLFRNRPEMPGDPGDPVGDMALVRQPAKLKDVRGWTLDTRMFRGRVNTIAYSPDSKLIATAGDDATIRIWDIRTGALQKALAQQASIITNGHGEYDAFSQTLAWSPDGKILAAGGDPTGRVRLWDVETGKLVRSFSEGKARVPAIAWNGDGTRLVTGHFDGNVRLWSVEGELLITVRKEQAVVRAVALSADGKRFAADYAGKPVVWRADGTESRFLGLATPDAPCANLAFSPDGKNLAFHKVVPLKDSQGNRSIPAILDLDKDQTTVLETGEPTQLVGLGSLRWLNDGKQLAEGGRIWDLAKREVVAKVPSGQKEPYFYHIWAPDGKTYVKGRASELLEVNEVESGKRLFALEGHPALALGNMESPRVFAAVSPDGKTLAMLRTISEGPVDFWDTATGKRLRDVPIGGGFFDSFRWSAKGDELLIATSHGAVSSISWPSGETVSHPVNGFHFTPAPKEPLWAFMEGNANLLGTKVFVWNSKTGEKLQLGESPGALVMAWSPDGELLAVSNPDKGIDIWKWATKEKLQSLPATAYSVKWSPDGKLVGGGGKVWSRESWKEVHTLPANRHFLGWSADGKHIYERDSTYKVYVRELETKKEVRNFVSDYSMTNGFQVSETGHIVFPMSQAFGLCGIEDRYARCVFLVLRGGVPVAISPEGHYRCPTGLDDDLIYLTVGSDGRQETLTPAEFGKRFNFCNQPDRVHPLASTQGQKK